ncbi:MAG: PqqD family protein [Ignavibacteriaceae bacterium]|nr:PqqD family protein [Ignavibacteriaceae bacterium]NUM69222.1 PqqD family protein [Ignavibacteriaceae bacterium]
MKKFEIPGNIAVSESGFAFSPSSGETFNFNELGASIYKKLRDNADPDQLINEMTDEFDADRAIIEKDLYDFISELKKFGLLKEL